MRRPSFVTAVLASCIATSGCGDDLESRNAMVAENRAAWMEENAERPARPTLSRDNVVVADEPVIDARPDDLIDSADGFAPEPFDDGEGLAPKPIAPEPIADDIEE